MWQWLQSVSNKLVCLNLETKTSPQQQCFIITLFCQKLVFLFIIASVHWHITNLMIFFFLKKERHLFSGSKFLLQMLNGLFCHSDLPEGILIRQLLAFLPLPLLQLSHSHPQLINLGSTRKGWALHSMCISVEIFCCLQLLKNLFLTCKKEMCESMTEGRLTKEQTSALDLRSAAMSCTLSLCSFGADLYMSNKSFISFWDSWAFLRGERRQRDQINIINPIISRVFPFYSLYVITAKHFVVVIIVHSSRREMYLSSTLSIFSVSESFLFSSSLRCLSLSRSLSRSRSASLSLSLSRARCLSSSFLLSSSSSWSSSSSFFTSMLSLVDSSRIRTPVSPLWQRNCWWRRNTFSEWLYFTDNDT